MARTNKYFVSGVLTVKTFNIQQPKQTRNFSLATAITDIENDTPAEAIMQTLKAACSDELKDTVNGTIAHENIVILNACLIDSFEQPQP